MMPTRAFVKSTGGCHAILVEHSTALWKGHGFKSRRGRNCSRTTPRESGGCGKQPSDGRALCAPADRTPRDEPYCSSVSRAPRVTACGAPARRLKLREVPGGAWAVAFAGNLTRIPANGASVESGRRWARRKARLLKVSPGANKGSARGRKGDDQRCWGAPVDHRGRAELPSFRQADTNLPLTPVCLCCHTCATRACEPHSLPSPHRPRRSMTECRCHTTGRRNVPVRSCTSRARLVPACHPCRVCVCKRLTPHRE